MRLIMLILTMLLICFCSTYGVQQIAQGNLNEAGLMLGCLIINTISLVRLTK